MLVLELVRRASMHPGEGLVVESDDASTQTGHTPWPVLDQMVDAFRQREPNCPAGLVAWLSYESGFLQADGQLSEPHNAPSRTAPVPLLEVYETRAALVEKEGRVELITRGATLEEARERAGRWMHRLQHLDASSTTLPPLPTLQVIDRGSKDAYTAGIGAIHGAIDRGELQQVCLTYPIRLQRPKRMDHLYLHLRQRSPAGYCAFLRVPALECASTSPEKLFSIDGSRLSARPMKGTRKRGTAPDEVLAHDLRTNPKDRAENAMIARLLVEELAEICEPDTAAITAAFSVETYANVLQMTSTVEGDLRADVGPFTAFATLCPPGSMTGYPKQAACMMLEDLETGPRGLYSGSIAWIDGGRRAQFSVVIRSLQAWGEEASWHVGGGIVAASNAEAEWEESRAKAATLGLPE